MSKTASFFLLLALVSLPAAAQERPRAGKVDILPVAEVRAGMQGTAWTVFEGSEPEAVPVEVIGVWRNAWGPRQDVILAKLGGKAARTNVAGGMSGSPVYVDGKLMGAIALRLSVFSPDSICGITPIELMLEIQDYDTSRPPDALTPDRAAPRARLEIPSEMLAQAVAAGAATPTWMQTPVMVPIETPLTFSGFHENVLREFGPLFRQLGITPVQGGASGSLAETKPAAGWENALQPGDAVAGVMVSGDMNITGLGTVTHNDGRRVLAFGHSFFNLGPVEMPMSRGEVLMVLSSALQPNKFANATEIVGALRQDRRSGILGALGEVAPTIPVSVTIRSFGEGDTVIKEKQLRYNVFVQQKWTPYLMMITLFNTLSGLNDFAEEVTYRLSGEVELDGMNNVSLSTMLAASDLPVPVPMLLAGWWGDKFNRLFLNAARMPQLRRVNAVVDLLPERRVAAIESAWSALSEVEPGAEVPVKVVLRPYRGERLEREFRVRIPSGMPAGEHRILLSDADALNRTQTVAAQMNRQMDLSQTVSLINQERSNNRLYVSLVQSQPTLYHEDKALPNLPGSIANVMQSGRSSNRTFMVIPESAQEQMSIPFDLVVNGSYSLRIRVK